MQPSPLPHGVSGIFDEIVLGAEVVLVLALMLSFFRARRRKPDPPADTQPADTQRQ